MTPTDDLIKRLREIADNYGGHPKDTLDKFADDLATAIASLREALEQIGRMRPTTSHIHNTVTLLAVGAIARKALDISNEQGASTSPAQAGE